MHRKKKPEFPRDDKKTCNECKFAETYIGDEGNDVLGVFYCRRFPPGLAKGDYYRFPAAYYPPVVDSETWCGEFKRRWVPVKCFNCANLQLNGVFGVSGYTSCIARKTLDGGYRRITKPNSCRMCLKYIELKTKGEISESK